MKLGTVTGCVWATKKSPDLRGLSLLLVQMGQMELVAADLVGAGTGDRVIVTFGSAARLGQEGCPVDAAIIGILDEEAKHVCR